MDIKDFIDFSAAFECAIEENNNDPDNFNKHHRNALFFFETDFRKSYWINNDECEIRQNKIMFVFEDEGEILGENGVYHTTVNIIYDCDDCNFEWFQVDK